MKILRNPEIKRMLALFLIVGAVGCCICFAFSRVCGFASLGMTALVILLYLWDARKRYALMSEFANDIDSILNGKGELNMQRYSEGELSILRSEVGKLTVRLGEQAELLKKDKLRLADSMADISHQIRTPLTTLNLAVAALRDDAQSETKRLESLRKIQNQLVRIDWLVSSLLKLARFDADAVEFRRDKVELETLIRIAAEPLLICMELKEQTFRAEASGSMIGDASWTAEAVSNILKNCTEHMGAGEICVSAHENPLYSEIVISDDGAGIDENDLPHLFERFYRGKNSNENGFGIGLALSRTIITRQNGTVKAENRRDGGAMFTIRFYKGII